MICGHGPSTLDPKKALFFKFGIVSFRGRHNDRLVKSVDGFDKRMVATELDDLLHPCYPDIHRRPSRGFSIVKIEQSSEARCTLNGTIDLAIVGCLQRLDKLAVEALMESLLEIMIHVLSDHIAEMLLAEEHEIVETLVLNRFHGSDQERLV